MSTTAPAIPSLDNTFGCLFVACILTTALWGAASVQLYYYYDKYWRTDRRWLKLYVLTVWALQTTLQVVTVHSMYKFFVKNFGNFSGLVSFDKETDYGTMFTALVDILVQLFFCRRIWLLSGRNIILTGLGVILAIAHFVLLLVYFGLIYNFTLMSQLQDVIEVEHGINATTAAADIYIAGVLVILLHRGRSGMKTHTDSVINKLIFYTVGTSLVTAVCVIAALIVERAAPDTFVYILLDLLVPAIYTNSMLASLNSRESLRNELSGTLANVPTIHSTFRAAGSDDTEMQSTGVYTDASFALRSTTPSGKPKSLGISPSDSDVEAGSTR